MSRAQLYPRFLYITLLYSIILLNNACCSKKNSTSTKSNLIQACPEEWIQNNMPGLESKDVKEYFIYEGQRRELKEFDLEWIKKNCNVKPQIVQ